MAITPTSVVPGASGSAGAFKVDGLASGIQTGQIIDALVKSAGLATDVLQNQQTILASRRDAIRSLNTKLLAAQLDLADLRRPSTFLSPTTTSSAAGVATATATSSAALGSFTVTVDRAAQAQQLVSGGLTSSSASIGTGTVVIGSGATSRTLTINATNSSLDGLASTINAAGIGLKAQVINDGSASPYRLVLTSARTGAANTISFDATGLSGGDPTLDPVTVRSYAASSTSAVGVGGVYTGVNGPPQYLVQVDSGGTVGVNATFKWSKDGGTTWTTGVATAVGAVSLGDGVTATFGSGALTTGDSFTLRPLQQLAAAQDAAIRYGSGGSTISVTSATNSITGVVPGVTLNVASAGTATITVANDPTTSQKAVTSFFDDLNKAITYLNDNAGYDPTTDNGGILIAQSDLRSGVDAIVAALTGAVAALPQGHRTLAGLGVTLDDKKGTFTVDTAALSAALTADPTTVSALFGNGGTSTDARISFAALSDKTSVSIDHAVAVTQSATQATLAHQAIVASAGATVVVGTSNDRLDLTVNSESISVRIAHGTYTLAQLAAQVRSSVNASITSPADQVQVAVDGLGIAIGTQQYGSGQSITVGSASTATATLGITGMSAFGLDVAGSIDGVAAVGQGQVLRGAVGTPADGLQVIVTGYGPIASATIHAYKGLAGLAGDALAAMTDVSTGTATAEDNAVSANIDSLGKTIAKQNESLNATRARLELQFQQMEQLIHQFNSQGSVLTSQVKGFENVAAGK